MNKLAITIVLAISSTALARPASAQEISYHLPRGAILAGYKWQLKKCPTLQDQSVIVSHGPNIKGDYEKGELVRINPRSPFLGSRKIVLTYHENGTIKTINAEGEGKGGVVIASLLKTAAGFVGIKGNLLSQSEEPTPPTLTAQCTASTFEKVERWTLVSNRIEQLQGRVAAGEVLTGVQKALYDSDLKEEAELAKALTIMAAADRFDRLPDTWPRNERSELLATYIAISAVSRPDFSKWFEGNVSGAIETPVNFCARYSVKLSDVFESTPLAQTAAPDFTKVQNRFLYRRPVPVLVELIQTSPAADRAADCTAISAKPTVFEKRTIAIPQLSGAFFTLPIGSGAFENKAIAAEFTPEGRAVSMSYSSTGAGANIAEALAGGLAAAQALRDADLAETKRQIERIKAENELEALREAAEEAEADGR